VDTSQPTVTIDKASGQTDPTSASPINFTVVFSEDVTGFDHAADVTLSGSAGATTAVITGGPTTYNVEVSGMTGDGTVIANIPAGAATDGANLSASAIPVDNSVIYDTMPPSVGIEQAVGQNDPTNVGPINFTVTFSEEVTDFDDASDVTLSGTAGATTINITGGPTTYNVAVSGMSGAGTVTASIPAGVAVDLASQANTASGPSTDATVTYDATPPNTTIDTSPTDPSSSANASFTFSGSDTGTGIAGYQCRLDSSNPLDFGACTGATSQSYTGLAEGSHTFEVRAIDAAGNVDPSPDSFTWVIDTTAPTR